MANKKKNLRNNLQKYRVWKGLLQADLASNIGMSISEIRLIENQKVTPNSLTTNKLLQYFNVSFNQMFYEAEA